MLITFIIYSSIAFGLFAFWLLLHQYQMNLSSHLTFHSTEHFRIVFSFHNRKWQIQCSRDFTLCHSHWSLMYRLYTYWNVFIHAGGASCVAFKQEVSFFICRPPLLRTTGQAQGQLDLSSDENIYLDIDWLIAIKVQSSSRHDTICAYNLLYYLSNCILIEMCYLFK